MSVAIHLPKNGEGFVLRSFTREDIDQLAEIEFAPEVKRFLKLPDQGKAQWIAQFDPATCRGWAIDVGGVLAGRASILRGKRRGDGELAIIIAQPFWGSRLGRRVASLLIQTAFEELKATALIAIVHPEHHASIALLRAFKFRRCGIIDSLPDHWQQGHLIYRLSKRSYGLSIQART